MFVVVTKIDERGAARTAAAAYAARVGALGAERVADPRTRSSIRSEVPGS